MARLNGWQRLWIVLSAIWQVPVLGFFALWASDGSLQIYVPPTLEAWEMLCSLDDVASETRIRFPTDYRDLSDAQLKALIAKTYFDDRDRELKLEFWAPRGANTNNLSCAHVSKVTNPDTNREQLAVLATLDIDYPTWHKGHNMASALDPVTKERVDRSRRQRRNGLLFTVGAAILPPTLLYTLGAAVAWIRRGFHPQPPRPLAGV